MSVLTPFWNSAALVYRLRSSVTSRTPKAPEPLACGLRSGTRSRLKCAICSRKCTSCSRVGPLAPRVRELRSLMASHRPYRPALGIDIALEEIEQNKDILYDPDVAEACLKLF